MVIYIYIYIRRPLGHEPFRVMKRFPQTPLRERFPLSKTLPWALQTQPRGPSTLHNALIKLVQKKHPNKTPEISIKGGKGTPNELNNKLQIHSLKVARRKWKLCSRVHGNTIFKVLEGLVSDLFGILFQTCARDPPRRPQIRKTIKMDPRSGILFRDRGVLESPFGVLGFRWWFQNRFFMHPGAFEATQKHTNKAKTTKKTSNIMQWTSKATLFSWPCGRKRKHICACHFLSSASIPVFQSIFSGPPGDAKRIEYIYIYSTYMYVCIYVYIYICSLGILLQTS